MCKISPAVAVLGSLLAAALHVACGGQSQAGPSPTLKIDAIVPARGSTLGTTSVKILGDGFVTGMKVRIDGAAVPATLVAGQMMQVTMPAHAAGSVDITVMTPSGASATLHQAYVFETLTVSSITPATGVLDGNNVVSIVGAGFADGAKVTFDGVQAKFADYVPGSPGAALTSTLVRVYAPAHVAGLVDVVVINRDGQLRLPNGYTYAPSETFDFNGVWTGVAWETELPIRFTIENNNLVSVSCGSASHTFSPAVSVTKGAFSVTGADINMSGSISSPIEANGLLEIPDCLSAWGWTANK